MKKHLMGTLAVACLSTAACSADLGTEPLDAATTDSNGEAVGSLEQGLANRDLAQPWVGMIPAAADSNHLPSCADGYEYIKFDDEDSSNNNQLTVGNTSWKGHNVSFGGIQRISSPRRGGGNTKLVYCKRPMSQLPVLAYDYAVISASDVCPTGTFRFTRRWDNEDSSNHNKYSEDIRSNSGSSGSGGWSSINFCFVPGAAGQPSWDPSLDSWIIWTAQDLSSLGYVSGNIYTDDEDSSNNNQYSVASNGNNYTSRMQAIISSGSNTRMKFASKAIAYQDFGTGSSCATQNAIAYGFYGAATMIYNSADMANMYAWIAVGGLAGVGLAIQGYCAW